MNGEGVKSGAVLVTKTHYVTDVVWTHEEKPLLIYLPNVKDVRVCHFLVCSHPFPKSFLSLSLSLSLSCPSPVLLCLSLSFSPPLGDPLSISVPTSPSLSLSLMSHSSLSLFDHFPPYLLYAIFHASTAQPALVLACQMYVRTCHVLSKVYQ